MAVGTKIIIDGKPYYVDRTDPANPVVMDEGMKPVGTLGENNTLIPFGPEAAAPAKPEEAAYKPTEEQAAEQLRLAKENEQRSAGGAPPAKETPPATPAASSVQTELAALAKLAGPYNPRFGAKPGTLSREKMEQDAAAVKAFLEKNKGNAEAVASVQPLLDQILLRARRERTGALGMAP